MDKNKEELNRLYRLLCEREKEFDTAKRNRTIVTIIGFAIFYFIVIYAVMGKPTGMDIIYAIVIAVVLSGFHFFINASIFGSLFQKSLAEDQRLKDIQKQIDELKNSTTERW